jgi:hypothetical protein
MAGDTFASSGFSESAPQQNTIARYSADSLCNVLKLAGLAETEHT